MVHTYFMNWLLEFYLSGKSWKHWEVSYLIQNLIHYKVKVTNTLRSYSFIVFFLYKNYLVINVYLYQVEIPNFVWYIHNTI